MTPRNAVCRSENSWQSLWQRSLRWRAFHAARWIGHLTTEDASIPRLRHACAALRQSEAIAVVVSGLNDLYMPSSTLLFIRVLSKMLDMEVELPAELMDNPYLCAWFMREFAYWLLQYVDDYCKLSQDE